MNFVHRVWAKRIMLVVLQKAFSKDALKLNLQGAAAGLREVHRHIRIHQRETPYN